MRALQWGGKLRQTSGMLLPGVLLGACLIGNLLAEEGAPRRTKRQDRPSAEAFPSSTPVGDAGENPTGAGQPQISPDHPLLRLLKRAYESRKAMAEVKDYSALFVKKERLRGNPNMVEQVIDLKLRHEPFSVYMRFRSPEAGREVIYMAGAYDGKLQVHEEGIKSIAGTLSLALNDPAVLKASRHSITQVGIGNMLEVIIKQWEEEAQYGEVEVKRFPKAKLGDIACEALVSIHPQRRKEFKFHKTILYLDKETKLPIRVEQFGWPHEGRPPALIEEYTYANLKTNVNLDNRDFDTRNPKYRF